MLDESNSSPGVRRHEDCGNNVEAGKMEHPLPDVQATVALERVLSAEDDLL